MSAVELTSRDIEVVQESLTHAKRNVSDGSAPYELKQKKLAEIDEVLAKLKQAH
jgi:hypothetical protein